MTRRPDGRFAGYGYARREAKRRAEILAHRVRTMGLEEALRWGVVSVPAELQLAEDRGHSQR